MKQGDFNEIVKGFIEESELNNCSIENHRYASFDYCYNYFSETEELSKDIEKSCLVLGFYLASWGMYRGSSFILQKSLKYLQPTVEYIAKLKDREKEVWEIDVNTYDEKNINKILEIYTHIRQTLILPEEENRKNGKKITELTLITKVLLGVFGFVPAFDDFFCRTFRNIKKGNIESKFRIFDIRALNVIREFYIDNKDDIEHLASETKTIEFISGGKKLNYTRAKIIDMYGFNKRS